MLKVKSAQESFYGSYLYDKIVPPDHLLRKINQVVDFSFVNELVRDRYTPNFGRPAEDPEFMLRLGKLSLTPKCIWLINTSWDWRWMKTCRMIPPSPVSELSD
jgi:hypothetical protein